jgi:hypothetical protein
MKIEPVLVFFFRCCCCCFAKSKESRKGRLFFLRVAIWNVPIDSRESSLDFNLSPPPSINSVRFCVRHSVVIFTSDVKNRQMTHWFRESMFSQDRYAFEIAWVIWHMKNGSETFVRNWCPWLDNGRKASFGTDSIKAHANHDGLSLPVVFNISGHKGGRNTMHDSLLSISIYGCCMLNVVGTCISLYRLAVTAKLLKSMATYDRSTCTKRILSYQKVCGYIICIYDI